MDLERVLFRKSGGRLLFVMKKRLITGVLIFILCVYSCFTVVKADELDETIAAMQEQEAETQQTISNLEKQTKETQDAIKELQGQQQQTKNNVSNLQNQSK